MYSVIAAVNDLWHRTTTAEMDFNWDNISVGEPELDTSGQYFLRKEKIHSQDIDSQVPSGSSEHSSDLKTDAHTNSEQRQRYKQRQAHTRQEDACERAHRYAQVYEEKRKALREREQKELEEMKQFRAKPAPNFRHGTKKENTAPRFTIPVTPEQMKPDRLKRAAELAKKMQQRVAGQEQDTFRARDAKVLKEKPFKPVLPKTAVVAEPFELRVSARLKQRKQYDEQLMQSKQEQAQREAEERQAAEEQERKIIRKMKEFKANPNPFNDV